MKTQFDHRVRVVSLENLRALCARASGVAHTYEVTKVSRSRVHVTYSNPDEYGSARPLTAVFPCYPSTFEGASNPAVVLECSRLIGSSRDEESIDIQSFDPILAGPVLYRRVPPAPEVWQTRQEIDGTDRYQCPDGKVRQLDPLHPYTDDRFGTFEVTDEYPADPGNPRRRHFVHFTWSELRPVRKG